MAEKILSNYIKSGVINKQLGNNKGKSGAPLLKKRKLEPDLFELPPMPNQTAEYMFLLIAYYESMTIWP